MERSLRRVANASLLLLAGCAGAEPFRNVACFETARISLTQAVEVAEQQGGKAIDAGYRQDREFGCLENNPGVYDVTLLSDGRVRDVSVNAKSAAVGPRVEGGATTGLIGEGLLDKIVTPGHTPDAGVSSAVALTLPQAAALAEETGGKAMKAWIGTNGGEPGIRVKLVENGKTRIEWVSGGAGVARVKAPLRSKRKA